MSATPRPPRVAHVAAAPEFVGLIMIHDLRRLRDATEPVVFCPGGTELEALRAEGIEARSVSIARKIAPLRDIASVWTLWKLFRAQRVAAVHTYTPKAGLVGQVAAWLARVPVRIHSCRGLLYTGDMTPVLRTVLRFADRVTNLLANRTLFVSAPDLRFSVEESLCPPARARWTGNGVDLSFFDSARLPESVRRAVRAQLGVPQNAIVALTVGRFVVPKGYVELARAADVLARRHPQLWFVWVAPVMSGEAEVIDAARIDEIAASARIVRVPYWRDMPAMYAMADLLVHPSHREGIPRAVMEALAMGLPVVASDIPGCREILDPDARHRLVRVGDADAIVHGIEEVLATGAGRTGGPALAQARERLDQDLVSGRVRAVYTELGLVPVEEPPSTRSTALG